MGLLDSAFGNAAAERAAEAARKEYERKLGIVNDMKTSLGKKETDDKALFERQYYQDITKRTDVQNMLRMLDENQKKADTREAARAAIAGSTPEQQLASKEVNRKTFADSLANIAGNASIIRDQYMRDYQNTKNANFAHRLGIMSSEMNLTNPEAGIQSNIANQLSTSANNAFAAGGGMLANGLGVLEVGSTPVTTSKGGVTSSEQNMINNYLHRVGADAKARLIQQPQGF